MSSSSSYRHWYSSIFLSLTCLRRQFLRKMWEEWKVLVVFVWVTIPCSLVSGYQILRKNCAPPPNFCVKRNRMSMLLGYVVRLRETASPRRGCFYPADADVICYWTLSSHVKQMVSEPSGIRLSSFLQNLTASLPYSLQMETSFPLLPKYWYPRTSSRHVTVTDDLYLWSKLGRYLERERNAGQNVWN